mmetsp:Transcript_58315/g.125299  ORF Transcript_58315/g.125299 Transcript_58315/m.125299 type:complete len:216 (-) Transcript_58315:51-698(-)
MPARVVTRTVGEEPTARLPSGAMTRGECGGPCSGHPWPLLSWATGWCRSTASESGTALCRSATTEGALRSSTPAPPCLGCRARACSLSPRSLLAECRPRRQPRIAAVCLARPLASTSAGSGSSWKLRTTRGRQRLRSRPRPRARPRVLSAAAPFCRWTCPAWAPRSSFLESPCCRSTTLHMTRGRSGWVLRLQCSGLPCRQRRWPLHSWSELRWR